MRHSASILLRIIVCLALLTGCGAARQDDFAPSVTILHTNDVHGAFSALDPLSGKPAGGVIGHDRIAAVRAAYAARGDTVFLLDAGDATQGIYFVGQSRGEAAIAIMNAAGYDAMTLGNHEFDYGWPRLLELMAMADFSILSQLDDDPARQAEDLHPFILIERNGARLGVFGITTPETSFQSDGGFGRDFGDMPAIIARAQKTVDLLRGPEKADYVICLAHLGVEDTGYGTSYDLRDAVRGIDLIIDGHSHTALADIANPPGTTPITSTGSGGKGLGIASLRQSAAGVAVALETMDRDAAMAFDPDPATGAVIALWGERVAEEGREVVAVVPFAVSVDRGFERTRETVMGDIVTDAMRAVSGADIAMQNGGGIRDQELAAGAVTKAQLITILPFGNIVRMAEVKGSVILECLELGVSAYPAEHGGFMQVSGLKYRFNPGLPGGSRVTSVTVGGKVLDPDAVYTVCTNDFIAAGGDRFTMLAEPFSTQLPLRNPGLASLEEALIWYLGAYRDVLPAAPQGRIVAEQPVK